MKKNVRDVLHNIRIGILSSTEKMIKILSKNLFHTTQWWKWAFNNPKRNNKVECAFSNDGWTIDGHTRTSRKVPLTEQTEKRDQKQKCGSTHKVKKCDS